MPHRSQLKASIVPEISDLFGVVTPSHSLERSRKPRDITGAPDVSGAGPGLAGSGPGRGTGGPRPGQKWPLPGRRACFCRAGFLLASQARRARKTGLANPPARARL